jgi:hypothetical protein
MKETILLVVGISLGALGFYTFFCQKPTPPHVVNASVVDEKLKEVGELVFGEKMMRSNADIKIPKEFRLLGKVVATDGLKIQADWTGIHLYAIDLKTQAAVVEDLPDTLRITMPPYAHRVSYLEPGTVEFKTVNGSWFINKDKRYRVALEQIQTQNIANGTAFMQRGREELERACIQAVTGVVYPYVKSGKTIEVVCPEL